MSAARLTVVHDACVLYPAPLRSLLMYVAMTDLYRARWSDDIHEEWMRNVRKNRPDITRRQTEKIRGLMDAHVADCVVTGHHMLIPRLVLPDPGDRHVLAAAIHCGADIILTFNLRDFPTAALAPYGIRARHPDDFLLEQLDLAPKIVGAAAERQRQSLKNPPMDAGEYVKLLARNGLVKLASGLKEHEAMA